MKKLLHVGIISCCAMLYSHADFLMTLTDKNGVENNLCIKSYSFSNNLQSLHKTNSEGKDVYSTTETLTNKTWIDGKPIYKRVFHFYNENGIKLDYVHYLGSAENIEQIVDGNIIANRTNEPTDPVNHSNLMMSDTSYLVQWVGYATKEMIQTYENSNTIIGNNGKAATGFWFKGLMNHAGYDNFFYTVEYTKTTDSSTNVTSNFNSYVHYILSSSTSNEVITKNLENTGVRFLSDYTYDASTNSCLPTNTQ